MRRWGPRWRPPAGERGEVGIGILVAIGLTMVVALVVTNAFVHLYGQAVMRSAVDEGIRAGTRLGGDPVAMCEDAARDVVDSLIPGTLGRSIEEPRCVVGSDGLLVANVSAEFPVYLPVTVTVWRVSLSGSGALETGP